MILLFFGKKYHQNLLRSGSYDITGYNVLKRKTYLIDKETAIIE